MELFEQNVLIANEDELIKLLGIHDKNIKIINPPIYRHLFCQKIW